jgi:hypothetical protein
LSVLGYTHLYSIQLSLLLFYLLIHSILVGTYIYLFIFIFFPNLNNSTPHVLSEWMVEVWCVEVYRVVFSVWPRTNYRRDVSSGVVLLVSGSGFMFWAGGWWFGFWAGVDVRCYILIYILYIYYYIIILYTIIILLYLILYYTLLFFCLYSSLFYSFCSILLFCLYD